MADIMKSYFLQHHPDKFGDNKALWVLNKHHEITAACEVFGGATKRARHDCCGMEGVRDEMPSGSDTKMDI